MDFDFDGEENSMFDFNRASSSKAKRSSRPTMKGKKKGFGRGFNDSTSSIAGSNPSGSQSSKLGSSSMSSSLSTSSSSVRYGTAKPTVQFVTTDKNGRRSRKRIRRREEKEEEDFFSNDEEDNGDFDEGDFLSQESQSSAGSEFVSILRSKKKAEHSVRRGAGSSAFAFQDAGNYQMVHDECTYLCSTILSRTTLPSKAVDAAIDLATLLSSRKTRSMLWQGGDNDEDSERKAPSNSWDDYESPTEKQKVAPIPKIWASILEVLSLATTISGGSFENQCSSSNSSISSSTTATAGKSKKYRTKSARRKEKALLQTGGGSEASAIAQKLSSVGNKLNPNMKDVLAVILYIVSWDCTMSGEHSVAAIGAVRSSAIARRIRLAILERGTVLSGAMKLMVPSPQTTSNFTRQVGFPFNVFPANSNKLPDAPVSPLRPPSISKRSLRSASSVSSIECDVQHVTKSSSSSTIPTVTSKKIVGDPTAAGRRKRKNRRKIQTNSLPEQPILEDREMMPPPSNRPIVQRKIGGGDELSFADSDQSKRHKGTDDGSSMTSNGFASSISQKIGDLRAKVQIESSPKSKILDDVSGSSAETVMEGDRPWLSIVCLESLCRILTGKELNGKTSCLEGDDTNNDENEDDSDNENENENVVMVTNRLVGKSGMIPLLSATMSQSMTVATKLVFDGNQSKRSDEEYWVYCHNRLKLLSSIIDEACFFSERNRRGFCEDDPFSFQDRKQGLIFHILLFLQHCCECDLNQLDQRRSETMTLALRTLTSLTHDNPLAAEQMKNHMETNFNDRFDTASSIQGIQVLANLAFQLEESQSSNPAKASDHDMHRYDGTVFCLTTLANITEGAGIGRILMEVELELKSGETLSWLKWLCQWLVKQTESFRQEILSIGNAQKKTNSSRKNGEIHQDEEEKLVAAGNGCVVLACLITESDVDDDPESSLYVRDLIKKEMPPNADGSSSGLSLVVNTLKAYCNYYQMSMGQMSVAVVSPVRKLIDELEEIARADEDLQQNYD